MNPCTILGKKVAREIAFDRNTEGHMAIAARGEAAPHFSPEELKTMVERWKANHASSLRKCRIPGTTIISEAGCRDYLRGLRESSGDEIWESFSEICRQCREGEDLNSFPVVHEPVAQRSGKNYSRNGVTVKRTLDGDLSLRDVSRHLKKSVRYVEGLIARGELKATRQKATDGRFEYITIKRQDFAAFKLRKETV